MRDTSTWMFSLYYTHSELLNLVFWIWMDPALIWLSWIPDPGQITTELTIKNFRSTILMLKNAFVLSVPTTVSRTFDQLKKQFHFSCQWKI